MNCVDTKLSFLDYLKTKYSDTLIQKCIDDISSYFHQKLINCSLTEVDDVKVVEEMLKQAEGDDSFFNVALEGHVAIRRRILNAYYNALLKETCTPSEILRLRTLEQALYLENYENVDYDYQDYVPVYFNYKFRHEYAVYSWHTLYITFMQVFCKDDPTIIDIFSSLNMSGEGKPEFTSDETKLNKPILVKEGIYMETDYNVFEMLHRMHIVLLLTEINPNAICIWMKKH